MFAAVGEFDTRTDDEVDYRARHQHLTGVGQRLNLGRDVDGYALDAVVRRTSTSPVCTPARMSKPSWPATSRMAQAQLTARAGPSKVASTPLAVDLICRPRKRSQLASHRLVVRLSRSRRPTITSVGQARRRSDDVGEQNGGQGPIRMSGVASCGEKLFDLVEHGLGVTDPVQVVRSWQLHVLGPGDVLRQVAAMSHPGHGVVPAVQDERRRPDEGKQRSHVGAEIDGLDGPRRRRTGTPITGPVPPGPERLVARDAWAGERRGSRVHARPHRAPC